MQTPETFVAKELQATPHCNGQVIAVKNMISSTYCTQMYMALKQHFATHGYSYDKHLLTRLGLNFLPLVQLPQVQQLVPASLKQCEFTHNAFVVLYNMEHDEYADHHIDDSDLTINICLSSDFQGSQICFETDAMVQHEQGQVLIHPGNIKHHVMPISSGERMNIVIWYRKRYAISQDVVELIGSFLEYQDVVPVFSRVDKTWYSGSKQTRWNSFNLSSLKSVSKDALVRHFSFDTVIVGIASDELTAKVFKTIPKNIVKSVIFSGEHVSASTAIEIFKNQENLVNIKVTKKSKILFSEDKKQLAPLIGGMKHLQGISFVFYPETVDTILTNQKLKSYSSLQGYFDSKMVRFTELEEIKLHSRHHDFDDTILAQFPNLKRLKCPYSVALPVIPNLEYFNVHSNISMPTVHLNSFFTEHLKVLKLSSVKDLDIVNLKLHPKTKLSALYLGFPCAEADLMSFLKSIPNICSIRKLALKMASVSHQTIGFISTMKQLHFLDISSSDISDSLLSILPMSIETLKCNNCLKLVDIKLTLPVLNHLALLSCNNLKSVVVQTLKSLKIATSSDWNALVDSVKQQHPHVVVQAGVPLFLRTLTRKDPYTVSVNLRWTIADLKKAAEEVIGVSADDMRMIFAGKRLCDDYCLADYNIQAYSTIHIVFRLRG